MSDFCEWCRAPAATKYVRRCDAWMCSGCAEFAVEEIGPDLFEIARKQGVHRVNGAPWAFVRPD
jgi:hypothetical protein